MARLLHLGAIAAVFAAALVLSGSAQDAKPAENAKGAPAQAGKGDRFDKVLRIGVVNLADLFDTAKVERWKDVNNQLETMRNQIQDQIKELEKKYTQIKEAMETIRDKRSALYFKKAEELKLTEYEIKSKGEIGKTVLLTRAAQFQVNYYDKNVKTAIQAVVTDLKLDMVLRLEEPQAPDESEETVMRRINQRVVLFSNAQMDITKEVMDKLNDDFKKEKAANPPPPPPPAPPPAPPPPPK